LENTLGINLWVGVIGLALYSATFSIFGGLRTVVWTDLIQVFFLIAGGLFTTYFALDAFSGGGGFMTGLSKLYNEGMWIANIYYWGMNQYIIQRALAAKNIKEARKGIAFAAIMKLILPLIVVIPGIVAYAMQADIAKGDQVYSWVLNEYIGTGFKGICFAAVVAAVGSSISSIVNSASTIFTMDLYKPFIGKDASEAQLVKVGKITAAVVLLIGVLIAPQFKELGSAFSFIQKYTGYFSPGILVIFLFGMFWKRTSASAAMWVVLLSLPLSLGLDTAFDEATIPTIVISMMTNKGDDEKAIHLEKGIFKTDPVFNVSAILVMGILTAIYTLMW